MWFTICFNYLIKRFDNLIIYNFLIISDFLYLIIKLNIRKLFLNIFSFSIFQITNIVINWKAQNNKDKLKKVVFIGVCVIMKKILYVSWLFIVYIYSTTITCVHVIRKTQEEKKKKSILVFLGGVLQGFSRK